MTPRLIVDYQDSRQKPRLGWLLLGLATLLAVSAVDTKERLEGEVMALEAYAKGASTGAGSAGQAAGNSASGGHGDITEAEEVARQLATPWQSLFRSLERAYAQEVALLSVQPDVQRSSVAIVGEAKEYGDILSFVTRLKEQAPLSDVHLVGNEIKEGDPQRPIMFTISARWRMDR